MAGKISLTAVKNPQAPVNLRSTPDPLARGDQTLVGRYSSGRLYSNNMHKVYGDATIAWHEKSMPKAQVQYIKDLELFLLKKKLAKHSDTSISLVFYSK